MTVSVVSSSFYSLFQAVITSHVLLGLENLNSYKLFFQYATFTSPNSAMLTGRLDAKTDGLLVFFCDLLVAFTTRNTHLLSLTNPLLIF